MSKHKKFQSKAVQEKFETYPAGIQSKLLYLRSLIFSVASEMPEVGEIEETLKWGEPSYITAQSKSGSTIRMDWKSKTPDHYYLYFNCKTTLVDSIKEMFGDIFNYGGNRSLIFHKDTTLPEAPLSESIAMALSYHLTKKRR